jgi:hypothetical protein
MSVRNRVYLLPHRLERRLKEWSREGKKGFAGICPLCPKQDVLPSELASELGAGSLRVSHLPAG